MPLTWQILERIPAGTPNPLGGHGLGGRWLPLIREIEIGYVLFGDAMAHQRAMDAATALGEATPKRTGLTAMAWDVLPQGPHGWAVVNRRRASNGFLVASGLITGTGERGINATGYTGTFATGWPGMPPSKTLRPAWEAQVAQGNFRLIPFMDWMRSTGPGSRYY